MAASRVNPSIPLPQLPKYPLPWANWPHVDQQLPSTHAPSPSNGAGAAVASVAKYPLPSANWPHMDQKLPATHAPSSSNGTGAAVASAAKYPLPGANWPHVDQQLPATHAPSSSNGEGTAVASDQKTNNRFHFDELIRSLPEKEREVVIAELSSDKVARRLKSLRHDLALDKFVGGNLLKSRRLFLAALEGLRLGQITYAQLASLHITDSAIHTFAVGPRAFFSCQSVDNNGDAVRHIKDTPIENHDDEYSVEKYRYDSLCLPNGKIDLSKIPPRMLKPLMCRYFNFNDQEWLHFRSEMAKAPLSEQSFGVIVVFENVRYSLLMHDVQRILKCMHTLDRLISSNQGLDEQQIVVVPSFTMFQVAINVKALTLGRKPVELVPTYGYVDPDHYAKLKAAGQIAFTLYMPEKKKSKRYSDSGGFRATVDGHKKESAFAGKIHDWYHAVREMIMYANVASARMRLVEIAKKHPNNSIRAGARPVDDILVDGELIYSYPRSLDTIFDEQHRPSDAQKFGDLFYTPIILGKLHDNLKHAFIRDMVDNESLWRTEFELGKDDLLSEDQKIFDQLKLQKDQNSQAGHTTASSSAQAARKQGLFAKKNKQPPVVGQHIVPSNKKTRI